MLPPTNDRIADSIERLKPIIEKYSGEAEEERRQSDAVIQAIRDKGLLKLWTPRQYGGDEADIRTFMQTVEAIARIDASTAWVYANIAAGDIFGAFLPEAGAKQIWADGRDKAMPG